MVDMSCEEHDRFAAGSQFVTHTVGRWATGSCRSVICEGNMRAIKIFSCIFYGCA